MGGISASRLGSFEEVITLCVDVALMCTAGGGGCFEARVGDQPCICTIKKPDRYTCGNNKMTKCKMLCLQPSIYMSTKNNNKDAFSAYFFNTCF